MSLEHNEDEYGETEFEKLNLPLPLTLHKIVYLREHYENNVFDFEEFYDTIAHEDCHVALFEIEGWLATDKFDNVALRIGRLVFDE